MTQAPDFVEALAGYRAWKVDDDGLLLPVVYGSAWDSGVNEAKCKIERHPAPTAGCSCGFHAFHSAEKRDLRADPSYALGGIGAWGEIDIFRTGFRSQFACVVALAYIESLTTMQHFRRLQLAAARYGVELVDIKDLQSETLKFAKPLPMGELPVIEVKAPRRSPTKSRQPASPQLSMRLKKGPARQTALGPSPVPGASPWAGGTPGFCIDSHLLLSPGPQGAVLSPTPVFTTAIGKPQAVRFCATGSKVKAGEVLAALWSGQGSFAVVSPVDGEVTGINEALGKKPETFSAQEWVVRIRASGASSGGGMVLWGDDGWRSYRRYVSTRVDERIRRELALEAHLPLEAGSPADLRRRLKERRDGLQAIPPFLAEPGRLKWLVQTLDEELAKDEALQMALRGEQIKLAIEVEEVERSVLVESSNATRPRVTLEDRRAADAVQLKLDAASLHSFWTGELDLARLTREQANVSGTRREALRATALVRRLCPRYAERARPELEARRQAWRELSGAGRWWAGDAQAAA